MKSRGDTRIIQIPYKVSSPSHESHNCFVIILIVMKKIPTMNKSKVYGGGSQNRSYAHHPNKVSDRLASQSNRHELK